MASGLLQSLVKWESENKMVCEQRLLKGEGPKTSWTRELTNDGELILVSPAPSSPLEDPCSFGLLCQAPAGSKAAVAILLGLLMGLLEMLTLFVPRSCAQRSPQFSSRLSLTASGPQEEVGFCLPPSNDAQAVLHLLLPVWA